MVKSKLENNYTQRLFNVDKFFVPKDDYPWFYLSHYISDNNQYILDAGCGNGKYCDLLVGLGYKHVYGIDLFSEKKFTGRNFNYFSDSMDSTRFQDNFFDIVFSNSVIYHLPDLTKTLNEINRILKPGGIVILTGHTKYSLFTLYRKIKLFFNSNQYSNLSGVKFRKTDTYVELLRRSGFQILIQDGYFCSFLFYPFYRRKAIGFIQKGYKLPLVTPAFTKNSFIAKFKSKHAYHFALIARKL